MSGICARHSERAATIRCPYPESDALTCHQCSTAVAPGLATTIEYRGDQPGEGLQRVHYCSRACVMLWDQQHPDYWASGSDRPVLP